MLYWTWALLEVSCGQDYPPSTYPRHSRGRKKIQIEGFRIVDTLRKQYHNKAYQGSTVGLSSHQKLAITEISTLDTQQEYTGTQALKGEGGGEWPIWMAVSMLQIFKWSLFPLKVDTTNRKGGSVNSVLLPISALSSTCDSIFLLCIFVLFMIKSLL